MSSDDMLDHFIRTTIPRVEVSSDRLDRLISATLARPPQRLTWAHILLAWGPQLVRRYALPMATAAILGLVVGRYAVPADRAAPTGLYFTSSTILAGF
jgi:hypothetical protein